MLSIKKYLDSNQDELLDSVLDCYRAALKAMGSTGARACPPVGVTLQQKLADLLPRISGEQCPVQMTDIEAQVERELNDWAEAAMDYYRQRTKEFKDLLLVTASTAEAVGERDTRYHARFEAFSAQLGRIADLQDLAQIRTSLIESAAQLKTCVQEMADDGTQTVAKLRDEVARCHARIEEVERIAEVDQLTGLANRQGIESAIDTRLAGGRRFCLMMLDLNEFKKLNDMCGHLAGDSLLKQFATELKAVFRATDCVGRWAGDEFVVVLDRAQKEAHEYSERIRKWVFGNYTVEFPGGKRKVHLEAALGLTEWRPGESRSMLLGRADQLMYDQKKFKHS